MMVDGGGAGGAVTTDGVGAVVVDADAAAGAAWGGPKTCPVNGPGSLTGVGTVDEFTFLVIRRVVTFALIVRGVRAENRDVDRVGDTAKTRSATVTIPIRSPMSAAGWTNPRRHRME